MGDLIRFPAERIRQPLACVRNPEGLTYWVKNLGWLLRHNREVLHFEVFEINVAGKGYRHSWTKDVRLVAHLIGGSTYETEFADRLVLYEWLDRPIFRGRPVTWFGKLTKVGVK